MTTKEKLKKVRGTWLEVTRAPYINVGTKESTRRALERAKTRIGRLHKVKATRKRDQGHYNTNNGMISYVDEEGRIYVGAQTHGRLRALEKAGYTQGPINVPLSQGREVLTDEKSQRLLERMSKHQTEMSSRQAPYQQNIKRRRAKRRGIFGGLARRLSLRR